MNNINALLTLISILIGLPASILAYIRLKKFFLKRKEETLLYLPNFSSDCIGRDNEKEVIKKHILSSKSIFVYGTAGIGKTTVIGHAILEAKDDIYRHRLYKKVLYHNFKGDSSYEYACDKLSHKIDKSGLKSFEDLLSENDYLIWLDECENTDCLNRLLGLSSRPVFIVASRNKDQERIVSASVGSDDLSLMINTLGYHDAEGLLSRRFGLKLFVGNKYHSINQEIVKLVNGHPLILYLIKNDSLYKRDPNAFYEKYKVDINQFKINYPGRYEEEVCKNLIKSSLGLVVDKQVEHLSSDAQKTLGFLGCLSDDEFPIIVGTFKGLPNKDVINELIKTKIVAVYDKSIKFKHSLVHEVLHENAGELLEGDYSSLFDFIQIVVAIDAKSKDEENGSGISKLIFPFKRHLFDAIKYVIQNHLVSNSDNELEICYGLYLLADLGYYEDVLSLIEQFTPVYDFDTCYNFISLAQITSYLCLGDFEKAIACAEEYEASIPEGAHESKLMAFNNSLFAYIKSEKFEDALKKSKMICEYLETNHLSNTNEYDNCLLDIIALVNEIRSHFCSQDGLKAFIPEQINLIKRMEEIPTFGQIEIIDAKLILAFSFAKVGKPDYAIELYVDIINSIRTRYSFMYPSAINTIIKIAQFYHQEGNYNQANAIFSEILPFSEQVFGNGHTITKKIRADYENNKEKLEKDGLDESKVLFSISISNRKRNKLIRRLFKKMHVYGFL